MQNENNYYHYTSSVVVVRTLLVWSTTTLVVVVDQIPFFLTTALGALVGCFPAYSVVNCRFLPPDPG